MQRFISKISVVMILFVGFISGCGDTSNVRLSTKDIEAFRDLCGGLRVRFHGLGSFPIQHWPLTVEVPPRGGTASVYLEDGVSVPDGWELRVRGTVPDQPEAGVTIESSQPFDVKQVPTVYFDLYREDGAFEQVIALISFSEIDASRTSKFTETVWGFKSDDDSQDKSSSHGQEVVESFSIDVTQGNGFDVGITRWDITVDRRREGRTQFWVNVLLEAGNHDWLEPDVSGVCIDVSHAELGSLGAAGYSVYPWVSDAEKRSYSRFANVIKSWSKNDESGIMIGCHFEVEWKEAGPVSHLHMRGKFMYANDRIETGMTIVERVLPLLANRVLIPDWTTPVLRFSSDDIEGTALTPEEIAVFDVQKSETLSDPLGP